MTHVVKTREPRTENSRGRSEQGGRNWKSQKLNELQTLELQGGIGSVSSNLDLGALEHNASAISNLVH